MRAARVQDRVNRNMDYEQLWNAGGNASDFGEQLSREWFAEYLASIGADAQDLVVVAGGEYDINLVPMDMSLNRGWSAEGARFRALERRAAAAPGSLFFIRPLYDDDTQRPCGFEVGVQIGDALVINTFSNSNTLGPGGPVFLLSLADAAAFPIHRDMVAGCIDPESAKDAIFIRAWQSGPTSLTRSERCAVAGVTGHIAESVAELLLDVLGWRVLWHFAGPGPHGIDLAFLSPDQKVVVIDVKGTVVPGRIPRLSRRELAQMSTGWIDKADNPGPE